MRKNENGFPSCPLTALPCQNMPARGDQAMPAPQAQSKPASPCNPANRNDYDKDHSNLIPSGMGGGNECDELPLAYVYAPMQKFCMLYTPAEALKHGTLFENLYKPMEVYGRE